VQDSLLALDSNLRIKPMSWPAWQRGTQHTCSETRHAAKKKQEPSWTAWGFPSPSMIPSCQPPQRCLYRHCLYASWWCNSKAELPQAWHASTIKVRTQAVTKCVSKSATAAHATNDNNPDALAQWVWVAGRLNASPIMTEPGPRGSLQAPHITQTTVPQPSEQSGVALGTHIRNEAQACCGGFFGMNNLVSH